MYDLYNNSYTGCTTSEFYKFGCPMKSDSLNGNDVHNKQALHSGLYHNQCIQVFIMGFSSVRNVLGFDHLLEIFMQA